CAAETCIRRPHFGYPGDLEATFCGHHRVKEMVNVLQKKCRAAGCNKRSSYGFVGAKPTHCSDHQPEGAVCLTTKRCKHGNCMKQPSFGNPGGPAVFCKLHQEQGMVNVKAKLCSWKPTPGGSPGGDSGAGGGGGCRVTPAYGWEWDRKAIRCSEHAEEGMVNLRSQRCTWRPGCDTQPCFGMEGDMRPTRCRRHRTAGMVDIKNRRCVVAGCVAAPSVGFPSEGSRVGGGGCDRGRMTHCTVHGEEGMVNMR
ncbi:unnamed protein product, partial [Discosporangium mesarthrocarpum]